MGIGSIARRTFLIGTGAIAGGLAVGYYYVRKPYPNPLEADLGEGEATFNPFVKIAKDNTITVVVPRAEMGQGVQTTLAALVAEELEVELDLIEVDHGPADWAYFNGAMLEDGGPFSFFDESFVAETTRSVMPSVAKSLGLQVTGGSSSTRDAYEKMRMAGCAARHLLLKAAATRFNAEIGELEVSNAKITHRASGQSASYGELAASAAVAGEPLSIAETPQRSVIVLANDARGVFEGEHVNRVRHVSAAG